MIAKKKKGLKNGRKFDDFPSWPPPPRHGMCQKVYTGKVFTDQILLKSAKISMRARLRQNSVNDR